METKTEAKTHQVKVKTLIKQIDQDRIDQDQNDLNRNDLNRNDLNQGVTRKDRLFFTFFIK